jgi:hypothetical protein
MGAFDPLKATERWARAHPKPTVACLNARCALSCRYTPAWPENPLCEGSLVIVKLPSPRLFAADGLMFERAPSARLPTEALQLASNGDKAGKKQEEGKG